MPTIKEYASPAEARGLTPSEAGIGAEREAGAMSLRFGAQERENLNEVASVATRSAGEIAKTVTGIADPILQHMTTQQLIGGYQAAAKAETAKDDGINAAMASPNPMAAIQPVLLKYKSDLDAISPTFTTADSQKQGNLYLAGRYSNAIVQAHADAATANGVQSYKAVQGIAAQIATNVSKNPYAMADSLDQFDAVGTAAMGNMTPTQQAAYTKEHIAARAQLVQVGTQAAAATWAKANPEGTVDQFPYGDLDKDSKGNSVLDADGLRDQRAVAAGAINQVHSEQRQISQDTIADVIGKASGSDGLVSPASAATAVGSILHDPNIRNVDREAAIGHVKSALALSNWQKAGMAGGTGVVKDNPAVLGQLLTAAQNGNLTLEMSNKAGVDHQISTETMKQFGLMAAGMPGQAQAVKILNDPMVKLNIDRANAKIAGPSASSQVGVNQAVKDKQTQFQLHVMSTLMPIVAAGGSIAPYVDPKSPQYLFGDDAISTYIPTKDEVANQVVAPPAKPDVVPAGQKTAAQKAAILKDAFGGL